MYFHEAYEIYHGLKPGDSKQSDIIYSSAGLEGWADASFPSMKSKNEKIIKKMKKKNRKLKNITLGLISEIREFKKKIKDMYGNPPKIQHYPINWEKTVFNLDKKLNKLERQLKYY